MNQTKRNWLAALFATLAAVLLAAVLCFALPFSDRRASGATVTVSDAAELQKRMAAAQEGDTIQLSADITIPSSVLSSQSLGLYASEGHKSQTLDLNGHTLSIETENSDACFIVSGLTFTVVNSVPDQGGLAGKSHGSFVKGYNANLILRDIKITFENNSGSASTAPVVAGFENRLTLDNVTYQLTDASQPYVANVGGKNYTDLAAAVGAASDGQKVWLVASFEEAVTIPAGKNIKLDLNGNTLTSKESGTATVTNYGRLTIQDTAEEKGGITRGTQSYYTILNEGVMALDGIHVYNENAVSESAQASLIDNNVDCAAEDAAQLSIRGGTYETKGLNVVKNDNYGVLVIENGAFTNKYVGEDNSGGASVILASGASTTISGGTFKQMGANNNYVVRINVAGEYTNSVTISGGEFIGTAEDAPYTYPALYLMNVSGSAGTVSVSISGGVFKGSISERGAVTGEGASAEDALTVTGGLFEGNISLGSTMQVALQGGDYAMIPPNQYLGGETELYQYTSGAAEKEGLYVLASEQPANTEKAGYIKVGSGSSAVTYNSLADALVSTVSNNIYLLNDIAESVIYTGTANKTIRLQGYTWTAAEGSPAIITREGAGQVSIYGGTDGMVTRTDAGPVIVNHGKFQLASSGTYSIKNEAAGNYALIENDGMLTVANGTLVSDVVLKNSGTVNITSTSKAIFQGAKDIVNDGGNISIANGTFNGTSANIQNIVGTVTLRGGTYSQKLPIGNGVAIAEGYRLEGENAPYTVKLILAQISRGEEIISFTGTDIWKLESEDTIQNGDTVTILEYVSKTLASDGESFNIKIDASEIVDLVLNASFTGTLTNDGTMNISGGSSGELTVINRGTLNISGGAYSGAVTNSGSLNISGGTFEDAIVNDGGEIKITGGQFAGGGAHAGQGGAYIRTTYAYLADGYYFTAHNNSSSNLFTVGKGKAVATVSHDGVTMDFGSFEAAAGYAKYAAANASDLQAYTAVTITLLQDTVLSSGVDLGYNSTSRAASWLIDLNGKTVTSSSLSLFTVGTNSRYPTDVTIKDGELVVMSVATEFLKRAINVNYGTLTLEDVNISYGADTTPPDHMIYVSHAVDGETAELTIDGGKHYGTISAVSGASVEIKRGEFSAPVSADYLASGTSLYRTQENTYVAATAQPAGSEPVALAGAGSSLQDLLNAGGTVVLTENITASVTINADVTVTLDLNGNTLTNKAGYHTITNNGTLTITDSAGGGVVDNFSHARSAVCNNVGGTVVFSGGTFTRSREAGINTENNGGNSYYVLQNFGKMEVDSGVTVSMTSGYSSLFENGWYDGTQNATKAEAVLTINGGTFSGGLNTIKNDDWGVLAINGGKFTNMQQHAVLNWNKMEINGGTFEVTDDSGAVVYVGFANDSMDQGKLTITGGTFNGGLCAVYANTGTDIEISDGTFNSRVYALSGAMIAITGGTFNHSVYSASCENFISGGTFSYLPQAAYMADNCSMNSDGTVSDTAPVAQLDRGGTLYAFASLDDALGFAAEGDTVTLLADLSIASAIKIEKGITFDLNGHDISGACSSILIISADDVTVTNSGADESVIELLPTGMQQSSVTVINVINQESAISVRIENITVRHSGEDNIQQVSGIQAAYLVDVTLDNIRMEIGSPANLVLGVFVYGDEASASIANSDIRVDKAGREARAVHSQWADVTITNTQIETNDSGVVIFGKSDNSAVDEAISADKTTLPTLTLNNSEVNAEIFAVCGNGLSHGTVINIIDSIIVSRSAQAIYHPQYGYLTISGDTSVTGVTGIEMRAGNLIVEDGTITATGAFSQLAYGGGSTLGGVAVGVSQHTTDLPVSVTLEGGTYTATDASGYALYEVDLQNNVGTDKIEIDVRDGIFMSAVFSENAEAFISGGTFTKEFPAAEYVAENCSLTQYGVVTDIAPAAEIEKDGKVYAFATIADALALASRGDTITLVGNVTENVVIAKNKVVTLDLNGYTLTNATGEQGDHTILNNGTLTIIDGSYAGTGRVITTGGQNCAAVYNAIGGEVTLDGGTYTSNRTTGDYYIIQNHSAMTINDGVTVLQPSVVSSGIASGWYTLAEESQTTYLTINGGTFASNRITVKNDEINVLVINGGTFDQTEGYGDAGYEVQSVQNWAIGILGGGTFGANVQSWAYQSGAGIVRGSLDITGGAYLGTVSAHYYINSNESKEDDMPDVEISGGAFASQPAEKFLTAGFTTVSNSEGMFTVVGENSAEADALRTAQVNAQANVGQYLATLGLKDFDLASDDPYTGIQDDEVSLADETAAVNAALTALRTAYAYIAAARSEYDVAGARLAAMEAADALADALAAELSAYKAAATASIEEAAAATEQVGDTPAQEAVVVPTATYLAINSAETAEQVKQYWDNALQEISDIRTYRSGIEGQIDSLNALLTALNSEVLGADGTDGLRTVIIDAITTAQNAVMGASEGETGSSLKDVYDFLDTRIEDVILEIRTELIGSDGQSGALGALQTDITTILGLFAKDSEGYYTLQNVITEIGNAKDTILTGGENSVSAAIQAIGGVADSVVDALTKEDGALTELSKGIAEVRALLVTTGAGSEEINRLESLAQAIEQAVDDIAGGDFTLSSLNTAIADAQRELTGAIGTLETTVSGYNTLLGNYNTQLGTLSGTLEDLNSGLTKDIAAAQEDIDAILADLAAVATDGDVTALSKAIGEISASLAQMQATVKSIAAQVSAASAVEEAKEEGVADLETWLNAYLDELLGTAGEPAGVIRAAAYTAETTDGDIYAKLAQAFSEENAKLVLKYYNDALAAIDAAESVSDVTTAVSAFKAQVASVEAAAGNTPSLTAVYILLAVVLVVAIAVFVAVLLRRAPAPQPAAPAEGTPAAPAQETAVTEAAPEEEVSVSEGTPEDEASEEAPAEESAAEERAVNTIVLPELDGDREHIVIAANVRSFDEAYEALGDEARSLFNKVKAYALSKPDTEEIPLSSGVCIKRGSKKVVKLAVRRGNPVALFLLESDGLKDLRRSASASVRLKVRETELVLREESDLEAAYTMVDLSIGQIERDIEEAKERRREARRLRRRQLRETAASEAAVSEETEDVPEEGAADETPADESDE